MSKYGLPLRSEYIFLAVVVVATLEAQEDDGIDDADMVADTVADVDDDADINDEELGVAVEDAVI
jgi:hypothetical protein